MNEITFGTDDATLLANVDFLTDARHTVKAAGSMVAILNGIALIRDKRFDDMAALKKYAFVKNATDKSRLLAVIDALADRYPVATAKGKAFDGSALVEAVRMFVDSFGGKALSGIYTALTNDGKTDDEIERDKAERAERAEEERIDRFNVEDALRTAWLAYSKRGGDAASFVELAASMVA